MADKNKGTPSTIDALDVEAKRKGLPENYKDMCFGNNTDYKKLSSPNDKRIYAQNSLGLLKYYVNSFPEPEKPKFDWQEKVIEPAAVAYSRRINIQHRLVYEVFESEKIVKIISMWKHYE
jgi:Txe/YoeB family toxin of toxin-antitoxin system